MRSRRGSTGDLQEPYTITIYLTYARQPQGDEEKTSVQLATPATATVSFFAANKLSSMTG